jgi:glycosyltransferase involved in cell wall biosynthesis
MASRQGDEKARLTPKVSVCIPAFEQPECFERALDSVTEQTFTSYEIVVTDDSRDDSVERIVRQRRQPESIRYQRNRERKGSPENWNEAIRLARGEYVKMLHHDDWFAGRHALEEFVALLDENPRAAFGFSASNARGDDEALLFVHRPTDDRLAEIGRRPKVLLLGNWIGAPSATIHRRSAELLFDPKLRWVVDIDFYVRILEEGCFAFTSKSLVNITAGAPHQVTRESEGNARLELFEWFYLYRKHRRFLPRYRELVFLGNLLDRYGVRSPTDVPSDVVSQRRLLSLLFQLQRRRLIH